MDPHSLSFMVVVVALAMAGLVGSVAAYRKERSLVIWAGGFASLLVGLVLNYSRQWIGVWTGVSLANLLTAAFHFALVWGWRSHLRLPTRSIRRFWLYGAVFVVCQAFSFNSFIAAVSLNLVFQSLMILELTLATFKSSRTLPPFIRISSVVLSGLYIGVLLFRLVLALLTAYLGTALMDEALLSTVTFAFLALFVVLWGGLVLLFDSSGLLEELGEKNKSLSQIATTDNLTGLSNRRQLETRVKVEMSRALRYKQPLSLIMFDLDHFKNVNDTWGHQVGDEVLKGTARVVKDLIRVPDGLFRWGGEEFMIVAPHTTHHRRGRNSSRRKG